MNNKGITLIVLVVTIVILLILSTVGMTAGVSQINNMKLKSFYTKLEIAQEGIEKIVETDETYKDVSGLEVKLVEAGTEPTEEQKNLIQELSTKYNSSYNSANFKFFTAEEVENDLGISGVELDLLIDFQNKIVISPQGVEIDGEKYYMLENIKYTVSKNETKNTGTVDFTYEITKYGSNSYKIKITPNNIGDITEGTVKYRKTGVAYWTVAKNNEIITNQLADYDIMYIDANNNSITKTITISLDESDNVITTEI